MSSKSQRRQYFFRFKTIFLCSRGIKSVLQLPEGENPFSFLSRLGRFDHINAILLRGK
jgi:hypothetical protein